MLPGAVDHTETQLANQFMVLKRNYFRGSRCQYNSVEFRLLGQSW
jgi:hypothetical protein